MHAAVLVLLAPESSPGSEEWLAGKENIFSAMGFRLGTVGFALGLADGGCERA